MSWLQAQAQMVSVVEALTPAKTRRGKSPTFRHASKTASEGPFPDSRGFWFEPRSVEFVGAPNSSGIPPRMRAEVDLLVFYIEDKEPAANFEDIAADHYTIGAALLAPSARGTFSTSSIIGIGLANNAIMRAQIEKVQGGYRTRTPITIEYRETP